MQTLSTLCEEPASAATLAFIGPHTHLSCATSGRSRDRHSFTGLESSAVAFIEHNNSSYERMSRAICAICALWASEASCGAHACGICTNALPPRMWQLS